METLPFSEMTVINFSFISYNISYLLLLLHRFWFRYNNCYGLKGNKVQILDSPAAVISFSITNYVFVFEYRRNNNFCHWKIVIRNYEFVINFGKAFR